VGAVNPQDRLWLATKWNDDIYMDCKHPLRLHLAHKIFNAVADVLEWVVGNKEDLYHYLDNYIIVGQPVK